VTWLALQKALWAVATYMVCHYAWAKVQERKAASVAAAEWKARADEAIESVQRLERGFIVLANRDRILTDITRRATWAASQKPPDVVTLRQCHDEANWLRDNGYLAKHYRALRRQGIAKGQRGPVNLAALNKGE
jgi:hypothetical protein